MNDSAFLNLRLHNQQLSSHQQTNVKELVGYLGAMQAQDFAMCKWAVGMRLNKCAVNDVESAINKGDIIRIHVMRPTWHLVAANDVHWMLQLTSPAIKARLKTRDKQLELTPALYNKANRVIENALSKKHLTLKDLMAELTAKKINVNENRSAHFMMHAEMDGIVCSGKIVNNKFTYALMSERIKKKKEFTREEALKELATRYFQSHGPAKATDFMWWCGLTNRAANEAINQLDTSFVKETYRKETYWLKQHTQTAKSKQSVFMLPAYDEYIISYKDRSMIAEENAVKKILSANGIFWPAVIINGKVEGKWNREFIKDKVILHAEIFSSLPPAAKTKLLKQANNFATFINKPLLEMKLNN